MLRVSGRGAAEAFADEPGGHRWQRIPPTEKRGRVQTSTVTVAVLPEPERLTVVIDERDLDVKTCRGSGAGGQHRNVTDSAVVMTHKPTGIVVRCESERSQHANRETAIAVLRARMWEAERDRAAGFRGAERRAQVGSGMRGDKRRTVREQDGRVTDHVTGQSWEWKAYRRGDW